MAGRNSWCDRNIAERLSFSSFTTASDDLWGVNKAVAEKRPYEIRVLPGYVAPAGLDKSSKDALWMRQAPEAAQPVWDGFCPVALWEIIYECFGFQPGSTEGKIGVFKRDGGDPIADGRDPEVLKFRPMKPAGMGRNAYHARIGDLYAWAVVSGDAGDRVTRKLYEDLVIYDSNVARTRPISIDSVRRESLYRAAYSAGSPRHVNGLSRGPNGCVNDPNVPQRRLSKDVLEIIREHCPDLDAVRRATAGGPVSLFELSMPSNLDPKTGINPNEEEIQREAYDLTLGAETSSQPTDQSVPEYVDVLDVDSASESEAKAQSTFFLGRIMARFSKSPRE
jgi:hypothetical protein